MKTETAAGSVEGGPTIAQAADPLADSLAADLLADPLADRVADPLDSRSTTPEVLEASDGLQQVSVF